MASVARLARSLVTAAVLLAVGGVLLFSVVDPGALLITAPLALALAFLLTGRRQQSLPLVLTGNLFAAVAIAIFLLGHRFH